MPSTRTIDRRYLLGCLLKEVVLHVDSSSREVVVAVGWRGGHLDEFTLPLRRRHGIPAFKSSKAGGAFLRCEYMSVSEVVSALGVHQATLYRWTRAGLVAGCRSWCQRRSPAREDGRPSVPLLHRSSPGICDFGGGDASAAVSSEHLAACQVGRSEDVSRDPWPASWTLCLLSRKDPVGLQTVNWLRPL